MRDSYGGRHLSKEPLTVDAVTAELDDRVARSRESYDIYNALLPILEKLDGRNLTKALHNAVIKELARSRPELVERTHWTLTASLFYIEVVRAGHRYGEVGESVRLFLGHDYGHVEPFDFEAFKASNIGYAKLQDDIERMEKVRAKIPEAVKTYNEAAKTLLNLYDYMSGAGIGTPFEC